MRFRRVAAATALLTALLAVQVATPAAEAASGQSTLYSGQTLLPGQYLVQGSYRLVMNYNGNLVLYANYKKSNQRICSQSHTSQYAGAHAWNSPDGYFAVYTRQGGVVWTTRPYTDDSGYDRGQVQLKTNGQALYKGSGNWTFPFWGC
jgi:hypothetical protein